MHKRDLLVELNAEQQQAVTTASQYTLVLAGAGSGKTRVLTHRIAWLCQTEPIEPQSIFAVTFTNKAATEMRQRIDALLQDKVTQGMWVGTFHGLAHRLLRLFAKQAGLPDQFQLIDTEDQMRLLRPLMRELNIDEKKSTPKMLAEFIAQQKEAGLRAVDLDRDAGNDCRYLPLYQLYEQVCEQGGYVDFAELLLRAVELLSRDPCVLKYCQTRFSIILVDEFQDTNAIQYQFIALLAGANNRVMIVGDDDQSIYGWRGASADNLNRFIQDHPNTELIRLEQNYRSTGFILKVANQLIANNSERLGKNLWTNEALGEYIQLFMAFNEMDEARFVAKQIRRHHTSGSHYSDCAVLYRNNALARPVEDAFIQSGIPYQIYGAMRFYERQEIKRALAYLRLLQTSHNNIAFETVVNVPPRGVGDVTLAQIRQYGQQHHLSFHDASVALLDSSAIKAKPRLGLRRFIELIERMRVELQDLSFPEQLYRIVYDSGLYTLYEQEEGIKAQTQRENLDTLLQTARDNYEQYIEIAAVSDDDSMTPLDAFLTATALERGETTTEEDRVQMMTLHSAKGLEFDQVFIIGMEENIFPNERVHEHHSLLEKRKRLEEERRLAYVGITRARTQVTLSFCQSRRLYGRIQENAPSRFLSELPEQHIQQLNATLHCEPVTSWDINPYQDRIVTQRTCQKLLSSTTGLTLGQRVQHPRFGEGTVIKLDGAGEHMRAQVAFVNGGVKWLVVKLANLTPIM